MGDHNYIDRTILKLKREYGKDELVMSLVRIQKESDVKIGQQESEIAHLESELKKALKKIEQLNPSQKTIDKRVSQQNRKIKKMQNTIDVLRKSNTELLQRLNHE